MKTEKIDFHLEEYSKLVGKTVKRIVKYVSSEEDMEFDYDDGPMYALEFTDGTLAEIWTDEEGNGPGFLCILEG